MPLQKIQRILLLFDRTQNGFTVFDEFSLKKLTERQDDQTKSNNPEFSFCVFFCSIWL